VSASLEVQLVLRSQAILAEGPLWDGRRQVLWWMDIERGEIHRFDPETAHDCSFNVGHRVGAVAIRENGGLLMASHDGIATVDVDFGDIEFFERPEADLPDNRFNDGKCDPDGRFWAGTMNLDPGKHTSGALYSLDPVHGLRKHLSDIGVSNGLAWSADGRRMFYIDSMIGSIDCFDFDRLQGTICNRRVVFRVPEELGIADGMTIDAEDKLWVGFWGGWNVARIDPDKGEVLAKIKLPVANVTSCTFGGRDLDMLFITTAKHGLSDSQLAEQPLAGDLFIAYPGVRGTPSIAYRG